MAARVSAVSPLCEMAMTMSSSKMMGLRYDHVLADESRVPRGAAADDDDAAGVDHARDDFGYAAEVYLGGLDVHASADGVIYGVHLLEYLFQHEVGESALLDFVDVDVHLVDAERDGGVLDGFEYHLVALEDGHVVVVEVDDVFGVLDDGGGVGGHEVFALAHADDERAALAGHDEFVRLVLAHDDEAVGSYHFGQCEAHGHFGVDFAFEVDVLDEVGEHLGVRLAPEGVAARLQFFFQQGVVFDDAVVHDGEESVHRHVGMGVRVVGLAVGGPAGVPHADVRPGVVRLEVLLEVDHSSLAFVHVDLALVQEGHSGRVISPVFQAFQAVD